MKHRLRIVLLVTFGCAGVCACTPVCQISADPELAPAYVSPLDPRGPQVERVRVGRAIIALGMTKQQVLDEIVISQRQHDELVRITERRLGAISPEEAERSGVDLRKTGWHFINEPDPRAAYDIDQLWLSCPAMNSRHLGDGSGFMLHLIFHDGLLAELRRGPWLGC